MSRFSENIQHATTTNINNNSVTTSQTASSPNSSLELPTSKVQRSTSQSHCQPTKSTTPFTNDNQFGSGPKRSTSGLLSIFKWFKKSNEHKDVDTESSSSSSNSSLSQIGDDDDETTPTFPLSRNHSGGSVASLYSTATVASFTFVPPAVYNPHGSGSVAEKLIAPGPETNTHKNRMKLLEKHRERDKNLTLRKKYRLFSCETSAKVKTNSSDKKKVKKGGKEKNRDYSELSLPSFKVCQDNSELVLNNVNQPVKSKHRRTVSDSSKDKKAGAYCHVKGKFI